jgi:hypothetical protein
MNKIRELKQEIKERFLLRNEKEVNRQHNSVVVGSKYISTEFLVVKKRFGGC